MTDPRYDALLRLTAEVRLRRSPGSGPELLGCHEGLCLLRDGDLLLPQGGEDIVAPSTHWDLAPIIDHTLLKADATAESVEILCSEAREHRFASVCVNGRWVQLASEMLKGTQVRVCAVVGFPLGAGSTRAKALEAEDALANGAQEVDMVLAIGPAKAGDWRSVMDELQTMRKAVPAGTACLKVILETCLLTEEEKIRACGLALDAGLDFVKTSTGFSTGGATEADVALLRRTVGLDVGVKASGGIRDYASAVSMVRAGATRLGLSASLAVVRGGQDSSPGPY